MIIFSIILSCCQVEQSSNWVNFWISLSATLVGIVLALILDKIFLPKLEIKLDDSSNHTAQVNLIPPNLEINGTWKFFRVTVLNVERNLIYKWLKFTPTITNCRAYISVKGIGNTFNLNFKGRWSSTPEPPLYGPNNMAIIANPIPVEINCGKTEILDIFAMRDNDRIGYLWNNENYLYGWKNPNHQLLIGSYNLTIELISNNTKNRIFRFKIIIGNTIADSRIETLK